MNSTYRNNTFTSVTAEADAKECARYLSEALNRSTTGNRSARQWELLERMMDRTFVNPVTKVRYKVADLV